MQKRVFKGIFWAKYYLLDEFFWTLPGGFAHPRRVLSLAFDAEKSPKVTQHAFNGPDNVTTQQPYNPQIHWLQNVQ